MLSGVRDIGSIKVSVFKVQVEVIYWYSQPPFPRDLRMVPPICPNPIHMLSALEDLALIKVCT